MLITPTNLNYFFTNLESRFWQAYGTAPVVYDQLCTTYPVSTEQWADAWIGMLDKFREWQGPRVVHQPAPQTYFVPIQNFELTEGIDQFKLQDDTYGIYFPTVQFMGEEAKKWPDYQLRDLLNNTGVQTGTRQNSTDGLTHWNTAHQIDFWDSSKGTYCNDFTGGGFTVNGILVGGALAPNAFATLWEEIASRKSESNESLGLMANLSVFPAQLKITADTILNAQFFSPASLGNLTGQVGAMENQLKGWTDRLCWPDLSAYPTVWYMLVTNKAIKPFSWLLRDAPDFVYRNTPQDPVVFDTHTYLYGSKARGAPAWGLPWLSARSGS